MFSSLDVAVLNGYWLGESDEGRVAGSEYLGNGWMAQGVGGEDAVGG